MGGGVGGAARAAPCSGAQCGRPRRRGASARGGGRASAWREIGNDKRQQQQQGGPTCTALTLRLLSAMEGQRRVSLREGKGGGGGVVGGAGGGGRARPGPGRGGGAACGCTRTSSAGVADAAPPLPASPLAEKGAERRVGGCDHGLRDGSQHSLHHRKVLQVLMRLEQRVACVRVCVCACARSHTAPSCAKTPTAGLQHTPRAPVSSSTRMQPMLHRSHG